MNQPIAATDRWLPVRGLSMHIREWTGSGVPFVLLHGLASNGLTWEPVARRLAAAGHGVVTVDQRGHGLSDKPETGYSFAEMSADLKALLADLRFTDRPLIAGQSWGGNVALEFAAHYPGNCRGLVLVDGGYIELSARPGATWEKVAVEMKPPPLAGMPRAALETGLRKMHPDWTDEGIQNTLGNFETLPDGTIRPWLSLDRHMTILRALWEQQPSTLYPLIEVPVLIAAAETPDEGMNRAKHEAVARATQSLRRCRVHWFPDTAHDIHVHRPAALADLMLRALDDGFF